MDQAQLIVWTLATGGPQSAEAADLLRRIKAVRTELAWLQRGGWRKERNEFDPDRRWLRAVWN